MMGSIKLMNKTYKTYFCNFLSVVDHGFLKLWKAKLRERGGLLVQNQSKVGDIIGLILTIKKIIKM